MLQDHHASVLYKGCLKILIIVVSVVMLASYALTGSHRYDVRFEKANGALSPLIYGAAAVSRSVVLADTAYYKAEEIHVYDEKNSNDTKLIAFDANHKNITLVVQHESFHLFLLNVDGSVKKEINLENIINEKIGRVDNIFITKKNEIILALFPPHTDEVTRGQIWVYRLSIEGRLLNKKHIIRPVNNERYDLSSSSCTFVDNEENFYLHGYKENGDGFIKVFSPDIEELFTLSDERMQEDSQRWYFYGIFFTDGEKVYTTVSSRSEEIQCDIYSIDLEKQSLGEPFGIEKLGIPYFSDFQSGEGEFTYTNSKATYYINSNQKEKNVILEWSDQDIEISNTKRNVVILTEDTIFLILKKDKVADSDEIRELRFYLMTKTDNPNTGKKIIRIGGQYINSDPALQQAVYSFNQNNDNIRAEIWDYVHDFVYEGNEQLTSSQINQLIEKSMNLEFMSENAPDIIYGRADSYSRSVSNDILLDLNEFIESDPDFHRTDYYQNILDLGLYEGKLYQMYCGIRMSALIGRKSIIGQRDGWTLQSFTDFADKLPENIKLFPQFKQNSLLLSTILASQDQFLNEAVGFANFNSEEFMETMIFAKKYGLSEEDRKKLEGGEFLNNLDLANRGQLALWDVNISNPADYLFYLSTFGEPIMVTGYPSIEKSGILCTPESSISIVKSSKCKKEAWEFVAFMFSKSIQDKIITDGYTPVRIDSVDTILEQMMISENAYKRTSLVGVQLQMTEETAQAFRELITRVDTAIVKDREIFSVVESITYSYFNDNKPVEEVVAIIQERVENILSRR